MLESKTNSNHLIHFLNSRLLITVLFLFFYQTDVAAETYVSDNPPYVSDNPPPDELIIEKAAAQKYCQKRIHQILGKLELSKDHWQVYYTYLEGYKIGKDMFLKKLDTNIWILECGDVMASSWNIL